MTLQEILSLSFVQGMTEFLPVSSSAHLILLPKIMHWPDQGLMTDVALHVGTLGAVLLYFWRDVFHMIAGFFNLLRGRMTHGGTLFLQLSLGTIPAVIFGFTLRHFGINPRGIEVIATTTIVFGILMFAVDKLSPYRHSMNQMGYLKAFAIGFAQAFSLIPGVSRSGSCIIMGRALGFKRPDAARFSFLLAIPAIIAAATLVGYEAYTNGQAVVTKEVMTCIGFSFLFGFMAIAFMMYWLKRSTLTIFVIYRLLLGTALFAWLYFG